MGKNHCDHERDFALVLSGISEVTDDVANALYEAGCDDATLALRSGRIVLTFSRSAPSMKDAILSAIRDVRKAEIGAEVARVDYCNLVTQSDIARRIGRTRQLVHQYVTGIRGPGRFPPPACEITEGAPLWYWCEVAEWLWQNDMLREEELRDAEHVEAVNAMLDMRTRERRNPELMAEIRNAVETKERTRKR